MHHHDIIISILNIPSITITITRYLGWGGFPLLIYLTHHYNKYHNHTWVSSQAAFKVQVLDAPSLFS